MSDTAQSIGRASGAGIGWGVLTLILGILAIAAPLLSGIAVSTMIGILVFIAGVSQLIWAFGASSFGKGVLTFLFGGISIVAGVLFVARPLLGLATITFLLVFYFVADGISNIISAFTVRPAAGWGFMVFGGIVSLLLGFLIWRQWPLSGAWAVGVLVGIRLIFSGWGMIMLGAMGRAATKEMG